MLANDKKRERPPEVERRSGDLCKKDADTHSHFVVNTPHTQSTTNSSQSMPSKQLTAIQPEHLKHMHSSVNVPGTARPPNTSYFANNAAQNQHVAFTPTTTQTSHNVALHPTAACASVPVNTPNNVATFHKLHFHRKSQTRLHQITQ